MQSDSSTSSEWLRVEVDTGALRHNISLFRELIRPGCRLMAVVKSDAYGHGLLPAARAFLAGGADVLGVHALSSTEKLRAAGIDAPVVLLGPVTAAEARRAAALGGVEATVVSVAMARELAAAAKEAPFELALHLKLETGVNRQGITAAEIDETVALLQSASGLRLVGVSSHFADIEDTVNHDFARGQIERFGAMVERLAELGCDGLCRHMSCSAAAILWPEAQWDLVRVGVSAYGIWPSRETLISARDAGRNQLDLKPALTWKCRVSQVKAVPVGETVGYGRSWQAPADAKIAVLPVGYADGYRRGFSDRGYVLLGGKRAAIAGRICMNLTLVDVTHISGVQAGDWAVLLGRQDDETITAEALADQLNTIAYEVLTLPGSTWQRDVID